MVPSKIDLLFHSVTEATNSLCYVIELESKLIAETQVEHTLVAQRIALMKSMAKTLKSNVMDKKCAIKNVADNISAGIDNQNTLCRVKSCIKCASLKSIYTKMLPKLRFHFMQKSFKNSTSHFNRCHSSSFQMIGPPSWISSTPSDWRSTRDVTIGGRELVIWPKYDYRRA